MNLMTVDKKIYICSITLNKGYLFETAHKVNIVWEEQKLMMIIVKNRSCKKSTFVYLNKCILFYNHESWNVDCRLIIALIVELKNYVFLEHLLWFLLFSSHTPVFVFLNPSKIFSIFVLICQCGLLITWSPWVSHSCLLGGLQNYKQ